MPTRITIAIDNSVPTHSTQPFVGEHGLSILIETGDTRLLLDTGQTGAVVHNLSLLGVSPSSIDHVILSHGHYDHTGGLASLLAHARKTMPVYLHDDAFQPRFSLSDGQRRFVGIPFRQAHLSALGADFRPLREAQEILPGFWLSGSVPRVTPFETGDARLVVHDTTCNCDRQDAIADDMALFCATGEEGKNGGRGLVVISGCTHSGLVNMVRHGLAVTGAKRLAGWIGGTHLGPASARQQEQTIDELQTLSPDFVIAGHCTGFRMMARLYAVFGERFIPGHVGTTIEF
ncbi:MAG: MBL fold metallo-hydrolase [Propionivibrio sp.]